MAINSESRTARGVSFGSCVSLRHSVCDGMMEPGIHSAYHISADRLGSGTGAADSTHSTSICPSIKIRSHWWPIWTNHLLGCSVLLLLWILCLNVHVAASADVADELYQMQFRSSGSSVPLEDSECRLDCSSQKPRPVCATDGNTYPNKCAVRRAKKCQGKPNLDIKSKGRCKVRSGKRPPSGRSSCNRERKEAQANVDNSSAAGSYIPKCNSDNTYAQVQCYNYKDSETCWCVTPDGKPITGSFKPLGNVDCSNFMKGGKSRRRASNTNGGKTRRGLSAGGCSKADKKKFNDNLIAMFKQEFSRVPSSNESAGILDTPDQLKRVIEWKFSQLDTDKDNVLKRSEIREIKNMVKKHVRPKTCAKNFEQACDMDQNKRIDMKEWSICLGIDIRNDEEDGGGSTSEGGGHKDVEEGEGGGTPTKVKRPPSSPSSPSSPSLNAGRKSKVPFGLMPSPMDQEQSQEQEQEKRNLGCNAERVNAVEEDEKNPDGGIFIPECMDDADLYEQVQCHYTGYCWCVNQSTGSPMPGPATFNETPDCENIKTHLFKGCPYPLKKKFLSDLLDKISIEMADTNTSHVHVEPDPDHTLEETAVRWKLHQLDTNRNNMLERKEIRKFKIEIRMKRKLRKCSRNFLRYCDENDDRKISMEEWIECTGIAEQKNRPGSTTRKGENPLGIYLKSS